MSLASCDPLSSVEYTIRNMTTDTVTITFYKEIMISSFKGYTVQENDSVAVYHEADSDLVATIPPNQLLWAEYEWSGLYREEWIVPMWDYVKSIAIGGTELSPELWKDESKWKLKTEGGGFGEGESRYYTLWLKNTF